LPPGSWRRSPANNRMNGSEKKRELPRPHPGVIYNVVSAGAVLLHAPAEIYFGLNGVGSRVWQLLPPQCRDLEEMCDRLSREYPDACPQQIQTDVCDLLAALEDHQLVVAH
jgi:Coenzyme PQQ synthesis protein D (PqqD)